MKKKQLSSIKNMLAAKQHHVMGNLSSMSGEINWVTVSIEGFFLADDYMRNWRRGGGGGGTRLSGVGISLQDGYSFLHV